MRLSSRIHQISFAFPMRLGGCIGQLLLLLSLTFTMSACSKSKGQASFWTSPPVVEHFPIANSKLKNCRFQESNPTYTYGSTIAPNPIICDEGVAQFVHVLNPTPLPAGIQFSSAQLSLVGTASERVTNAAYQFYVENEAGYVVLKMLLTVK